MSRLRIVATVELAGKHGVGAEGLRIHAIVSPQDAELVKKYKWRGSTAGYPRTGTAYKQLSLHSLIAEAMGLSLPEGSTIDHINRNKLDNTRENLRVATSSEQAINRGMPKNNTLGYKGISFIKNVWRAQIQRGGKRRHLGSFASKEAAYAAYKTAGGIG